MPTLIRQALKKVSKKKHKEIAKKIKEALVDNNKLGILLENLTVAGYKNSACTLESFQYDVMNYRQFPQSHWRRIRTTDMMKRTNKSIKRRSKVKWNSKLRISIETTSLNTD